jgi:hypothetical protein
MNFRLTDDDFLDASIDFRLVRWDFRVAGIAILPVGAS